MSLHPSAKTCLFYWWDGVIMSAVSHPSGILLIEILWKVTMLSQMSYVPSKCEKNVSIDFHEYLLYDISLWKWSCRPHGRQTSLCNHLTKIYMIPSWIFQMTTISHCGCDKMANILLMTLSNAFSSKKILYFDVIRKCLYFDVICFPRVH